MKRVLANAQAREFEETTGVRFFERLPDGYVMTESREATVRVAERIDSEMNALGREILGRDMRLQGKSGLSQAYRARGRAWE